MGYWSYHPLGGDAPMDAVCDFEGLLFPEKESDFSFYDLKDLSEIEAQEMRQDIAARVTNWIHAIQNGKGDIGDYLYGYLFVVPFTLVGHSIPIADKKARDVLKQWIGDGGASEHQDIPNKGEVNYPSQTNNWNDLHTTFDYAVKLHDLWDDIMDGKLPFDAMEKDEGVLATILKRLAEQGL